MDEVLLQRALMNLGLYSSAKSLHAMVAGVPGAAQTMLGFLLNLPQFLHLVHAMTLSPLTEDQLAHIAALFRAHACPTKTPLGIWDQASLLAALQDLECAFSLADVSLLWTEWVDAPSPCVDLSGFARYVV